MGLPSGSYRSLGDDVSVNKLRPAGAGVDVQDDAVHVGHHVCRGLLVQQLWGLHRLLYQHLGPGAVEIDGQEGQLGQGN